MDSGLVLCVKAKENQETIFFFFFGKHRPSFILLSYCFQAMVYGAHLVWYLLGNVEDCG